MTRRTCTVHARDAPQFANVPRLTEDSIDVQSILPKLVTVGKLVMICGWLFPVLPGSYSRGVKDEQCGSCSHVCYYEYTFKLPWSSALVGLDPIDRECRLQLVATKVFTKNLAGMAAYPENNSKVRERERKKIEV